MTSHTHPLWLFKHPNPNPASSAPRLFPPLWEVHPHRNTVWVKWYSVHLCVKSHVTRPQRVKRSLRVDAPALLIFGFVSSALPQPYGKPRTTSCVGFFSPLNKHCYVSGCPQLSAYASVSESTGALCFHCIGISMTPLTSRKVTSWELRSQMVSIIQLCAGRCFQLVCAVLDHADGGL